MCLYSLQKEPKIAIEDIECFKVLQEEKKQWITPYRDYPVKFNETLESEELSDPKCVTGYLSVSSNIVYGFTEISKGFFHSISNIQEAENLKSTLEISYSRNRKKPPKYSIFKAIIPKGAKYYIGVRNDLCSDKLIILKE